MYIPYQVQQCIRGSLVLQENNYLRLLSKLVLNSYPLEANNLFTTARKSSKPCLVSANS